MIWLIESDIKCIYKQYKAFVHLLLYYNNISYNTPAKVGYAY